MREVIPPCVAQTVTRLAHQHGWLVGTTRIQEQEQGWNKTGITKMSLYTQNDIIWLHVQETCLILVTTQAAISIDMRLGAHDFTDAINQAFDDISR